MTRILVVLLGLTTVIKAQNTKDSFLQKSHNLESSFIQWKNDFSFPNKSHQFSLHDWNGDIDSDGFITSKNGNFVNKSGRIKFFGVNICSDGAFPEKALVEKIANQFAASGVNCARIHYVLTK